MNPRDEAPPVDVAALRALCERVSGHFFNYIGGAGLGALQLAQKVPAMLDEIERLRAELAAERRRVERLRDLVRVMIENDMAADAVTVLQVWRKEAIVALADKGEVL